MPLAIQCDFDGTVTEEDVSFVLLDEYADGWRKVWNDYIAGKMSLGTFNKTAFAMIKAGRQTLVNFTINSSKVVVRPGFKEMLDYCSNKGYLFNIVSNGVDFYIEAVLKSMGIGGIEVFAARSRFMPGVMHVEYIGPDGREITDGFKEAYTTHLKKRGYEVVYIGNGTSDIYPSRLAHRVFAIDNLLKRCREENLACTPFNDFYDIIKGLESIATS